jgi:hypothetical protein
MPYRGQQIAVSVEEPLCRGAATPGCALFPFFPALLAWLATAFGPCALAAPIQLRPGELLQAFGVPLAPGTYSIPCVADWNGDGRKDLLVGYQNAHKIAVYINSGTDAQPVFTNVYNLQAGGQDIYIPAGGCGAPAPWVGDFDGDGKRDLLVGGGTDGVVYFYRNTNTDAAPRLAPGVALQVGVAGAPGTTNLSVGLRATPFVHDWDEDGLPDLLCGSGGDATTGSYIYFFKNTNTARAPIFAPGVKLTAGGVDLNVGFRSVVRVYDWDGDGRKDLICSSDTGVYWCRNIGNNSQPVLEAPVALCAPVADTGLVPIVTGPVPGARMRLHLVDWNNDGVMDLLVGNANGTISYYEGYRFTLIKPARRPNGQLALQWNSAPYLKYNILAAASPGSVFTKVATNVASGGKTTCWTNCPNGCPQFYQVQIAQ